ncbi:Phosphatidylinositol 4-phosphate 3-kinase C2 domain-containing subunit gamma [Anabarilius grahami]|uniref:Phosphatidylinositol 4-phosphate 3-kinase C2 domain-containing subunit gamma n=1 Tax=Anabarilius grahami TaxID=495550 RepID=A0A3N0YZ22_ANAGA|nr:Phosphatidylinositol 4-phosphate 3-kinase C2 domain-containing subunit gamma [Anabarilius grahami]
MDIKPDCLQLTVSDRMDPCTEDPAGRPEDHVFHGWDVPVFSEQDYLDLYTPVSGLKAADQRKEQVNVDMKNEEAAVTPAGTPAQHLRGPEVKQLIITLTQPSQSSPVTEMMAAVSSTAQELMEAVLETLDHSAAVSGQYLMKLCDSEEFLRRSCLQEKLSSYSEEVNKLVRSQCGVCVSEVVESVHGVCEQLCGVTTADLEEAVGQLKRIAPVTWTPAEMSDCETAVVEIHQALLKLLHVFFTNFDLDFRGPEDVPDPSAADVEHNSCMLQLNLTSLYRLLPGWINGYDHFSMSCSLTHCGRNLTEPVLSENISTSLQLNYKIQCNRLTLVHGTVLLSMSTQVPPRCPPSAALTDGHRQPTGVILQIDFPDSKQWRYERASARPGSVHDSTLCEELQKRIADVSQKHSLSLMTENEKAFLWSKRHFCSERNSYLHLVLGSAPQWRPQNLPEIYWILQRWGRVSCEEALFLLSHDFHDQYVRSVAVRRFQQMCDSELEEFLPQLVQDVFIRERWKIACFFANGLSCRLPLDPAVVVKGVNVETGDNLRQDVLVLQIVRLLDRVWRQEGLDMRMVTYRCISTGRDRGLVEVVRDAVTLAKIHQEWGLSGALREDTLEKWFHMRNKTIEDYEKAVMNFLHSCAGWCVATFVLGICDRHNDNIMIKHSGHMFHVDFGRIMGNAQKFGSIKRRVICFLVSDRTPFIFTPEMQRFITGGGENPQRFHRFVELCCDAFNSLRRCSALLLGLLQLMLAAGMPEMKDVQDLRYVHNNLRPHDSELEATSYFTRKIKESMESFPVKLNFLIHNMVQFSSVRRSEPLADSRISSSSNIQEAVIQKYTVSGKDVTYELKVTIEDGYVISQKSFSQFETLHKLLQKHFIESTLPKFPSWFNMSFTPSRKMSLLNKYLKELFAGPCRGNEYVCSLFLDGPNAAAKSESDAHLRPQIQLYLSYKDFKLSVMIKHLKNIRLSNGSCPDAYVVTRLRPDPQDKTKRKTKVVRSNDNPTFNELIEYRNVLKLHGHVLEVTVKSRKAFVAATNVVLGERVLDQEKWFPLGFSAV